jgi:triosephosphate isomerase
MRTPLIAGNWKMNGSRDFVAQILPALSAAASSSIEIAVFPPYVYLEQARALLKNSTVKLGAQNLNQHQEGAYTGEISAKMLKECGCEYVLIGHSERRQSFYENDASCLQKTLSAQATGLIPLLCVGETLEEREQNQTFTVIERQLAAVFNAPNVNHGAIVLAYEPVWAIGTGKTATPDMAQAVHGFMREKLSFWCGNDVAQGMRILYGGSVKADNAAGLLSQPDIDGALVGGASLVLESFIGIIHAVRA